MFAFDHVWHFILSIQSYLLSLLTLTAVIGDLLVNSSKKHVYKAICDNSTHAVIGGLTWFIICINYRTRRTASTLLEIVTCTAISSFIDLDHFVAAKSFLLKDAINLKNRPILHCTTIPLVITPILLLISYILELEYMQRYSLIIFTAFITHHTRDALRRGYWLYPFGSTGQLPYSAYILIILLIPYLVYGILNLLKIRKSVSYTKYETVI